MGFGISLNILRLGLFLLNLRVWALNVFLLDVKLRLLNGILIKEVTIHVEIFGLLSLVTLFSGCGSTILILRITDNACIFKHISVFNHLLEDLVLEDLFDPVVQVFVLK